MRSPRLSPGIGRLLERSSLCEFFNLGDGDNGLNRPSDYATKYRPELDLVLKDINVAVVSRVFPCHAVPANSEPTRMRRRRLVFVAGPGAGNLLSCSRCSVFLRLPKAGSKSTEWTFRRSDSGTVSQRSQPLADALTPFVCVQYATLFPLYPSRPICSRALSERTSTQWGHTKMLIFGGLSVRSG